MESSYWKTNNDKSGNFKQFRRGKRIYKIKSEWWSEGEWKKKHKCRLSLYRQTIEIVICCRLMWVFTHYLWLCTRVCECCKRVRQTRDEMKLKQINRNRCSTYQFSETQLAFRICVMRLHTLHHTSFWICLTWSVDFWSALFFAYFISFVKLVFLTIQCAETWASRKVLIKNIERCLSQSMISEEKVCWGGEIEWKRNLHFDIQSLVSI